jgi:hypothetical protein
MAGDTDDPEDAAARLEAALERIARLAGSRPPGDPSATASASDLPGDVTTDMPGPVPPVEEIAARLDGLIDRLRVALNASSSGGRPG